MKTPTRSLSPDSAAVAARRQTIAVRGSIPIGVATIASQNGTRVAASAKFVSANGDDGGNRIKVTIKKECLKDPLASVSRMALRFGFASSH